MAAWKKQYANLLAKAWENILEVMDIRGQAKLLCEDGAVMKKVATLTGHTPARAKAMLPPTAGVRIQRNVELCRWQAFYPGAQMDGERWDQPLQLRGVPGG